MSVETQPIIDVAQAAVTKPEKIDPSHFFAARVEDGYAPLDFEQYLEHPRRKTGTVSFYEDDSFSRYLLKHAVEGVSEMYADVALRRIVGLVNGHAFFEAGWGDHRAVLALRHTPDWQHWAPKSGSLMGQVEFAEHIEDGIDQIITPPGAEMLELAQSFHASTGVVFRSSRRLDNGETQLVYQESVSASAGRSGEIQIPQEFELALVPFEGREAYKVRARLRYRIVDGQLRIGYTLVRPEDVIRSAFDDIIASVESATSNAVFRALEPTRA